MEPSPLNTARCSSFADDGLAKEDPADLGGPVHQVVADWLRISYAEARRRVRDVAQLSPGLTLTAKSCHRNYRPPPRCGGKGCSTPSRVIQTFVRDLPDETSVATVEDADRFLAEQAALLRPDQLKRPPTAPRC